MYIIAKQKVHGGGHVVFLGKITSENGDTVDGYIEKNSHINKRVFSIPKKDIIIKLGKNPYAGKVHGFDTGYLYLHSSYHDFFGKLCWFYNPEKELKRKINRALESTAKLLKKKLNLQSIENSVWEIARFEKSSHYGAYMHSKDLEKAPHRFFLRIMEEDITPEYIILHEIAHYLHKNFMKGIKINAAWISVFNTSIKTVSIKKEESEKFLTDIINGEVGPIDFKSDLPVEDELKYKWILRTISSEKAISVKELQTLFEAEKMDEIKKLWPLRNIYKKELAPVVTEYATKNYEELFAESFALFMTGKKLPKNVETLMLKSLAIIKSSI